MDPEPTTTEAESLHGKIDPREMGSRVEREKPPRSRAIERETGHESEFIGLNYMPGRKDTRTVYEDLLGFVSNKYLAATSPEIVKSAVDEILAVLKAGADKKEKVETILRASISLEDLTKLVRFTDQLTDYAQETQEKRIDEEFGISVVFDDQGPEEFEPVELDTEDEGIVGNRAQIQSEIIIEQAIDAREIDMFWLQKQVSRYFADPQESHEISIRIWKLLETIQECKRLEDELVRVVEYDNFELVRFLMHHREIIISCLKLGQARGIEREELIEEMRTSESGRRTLRELEKDKWEVEPDHDPRICTEPETLESTVDLERLGFRLGGHFMSNEKCELPPNSTRQVHGSYEKVWIPAPGPKPLEVGERLVPVKELSSWAQPAFPAPITVLNRVQSQICDYALCLQDNLLVCAPTGSGKTNVAMLCILETLRRCGKCTDQGLVTERDSLKMVYIAPMKALVQEMTASFTERLRPYGIRVAEMSGDEPLSLREAKKVQLIVTTPEKWDVVTRKAQENTYSRQVSLMIIDEIHLLHDDRGPVLEAIIARTFRLMDPYNDGVRLVGLSATIANMDDIAKMLKVPARGCFRFDASYRPCPLEQVYYGLLEKRGIKEYNLMNEIVYENVVERVGKWQLLVFVHSRRETSKTGRYLSEQAVQKATIGQFLRGVSSQKVLEEAVARVSNQDLKQLLVYGIGIHHAGLSRFDRSVVERLFSEGHVSVLCCTSTLAWGVNLPAHTVIIKGTTIYSSEKGGWIELSPQDVLQMFGRAGRPQFDTSGEGILLTGHRSLEYYLSLNNMQLPIESQLGTRIVEHLNAEIVLGTISTLADGVEWLCHTYFDVRMQACPDLYGVTQAELAVPNVFVSKRCQIIHTAALQLERTGLVVYDRTNRTFEATYLGRIASHYYVSPASILMYNRYMRDTNSDIEILHLFSSSSEFGQVSIRAEERSELAKLVEMVPIPIRERLDDPSSKINVLLQAYISGLKLEGFALCSDLVFIASNGARLFRAMFEMAMARKWARLTDRLLEWSKMVGQRQWSSLSPLRQLRWLSVKQQLVSQVLAPDMLRRLERKDLPFQRLLDVSEEELGEFCRSPKAGAALHDIVKYLPRVKISVVACPLSRDVLELRIGVSAQFSWNEDMHRPYQIFWIFVADADETSILWAESFAIKEKHCNGGEMQFGFLVPLLHPASPAYFVHVVSDKWLGCGTKAMVSMLTLTLPLASEKSTELLDLVPVRLDSVSLGLEPRIFGDLKQCLWAGIEELDGVQTQVFRAVYETDLNCFVAASELDSKVLVSELCMVKYWKDQMRDGTMDRIIVYISCQDVEDVLTSRWSRLFEPFETMRSRNKMTGNDAGTHILGQVRLLVCRPDKFEMMVRQWKQDDIEKIGLAIINDLHLVGQMPALEAAVVRLQMMSKLSPIRIMGCSAPIAPGREMGEWIGGIRSSKELFGGGSIFHFHPTVRAHHAELVVRSLGTNHHPTLLKAVRPLVYSELKKAGDARVMIFSPSRKDMVQLVSDIVEYLSAEEHIFPTKGTGRDVSQLPSQIQQCLRFGMGIFWNQEQERIVMDLYRTGEISIVFTTKQVQVSSIAEHVILTSSSHDPVVGQYFDDDLFTLSRIMSHGKSTVLLFTTDARKDFYARFGNEPLFVESDLEPTLHNYFVGEIVGGTIRSRQEAVNWVSKTFMYRRMISNPNYYGLRNNTHQELSERLSEIVEEAIDRLVESGFVFICEEQIEATDLARISYRWGVCWETIKMIVTNIGPLTRLKGVLELVTMSKEFEDIPVRREESLYLSQIYARVPAKPVSIGPNPRKMAFNNPHIKAHLLLQCHFQRYLKGDETDLVSELNMAMEKTALVLGAMIDICASRKLLTPLLCCFDLFQMMVQGMWDKDSPLLQIPHLDASQVSQLNVQSFYELLELGHDWMENWGFSTAQKEEMRTVMDQFPNIDVRFEVEPEKSSRGMNIDVHIQRKTKSRTDKVQFEPHCHRLGMKMQIEQWWIIVSHQASKTLLKCAQLQDQWHREDDLATQSLHLYVDASSLEPGLHQFKMYLLTNSWMGADQEFEFEQKME